jgi:predicted Zn-dependent protease
MRDESRRMLSEAACRHVIDHIHDVEQGGGTMNVKLSNWWSGELRWARNRVTLASDRQQHWADIYRSLANGGSGSVRTNQLDDASITAAVHAAEQIIPFGHPMRTDPLDPREPAPTFPDLVKPSAWSDATWTMSAKSRSDVARLFTEPAERAGLLSSGYLEVHGENQLLVNTNPDYPHDEYLEWTVAQCSVTVRDPNTMASGWAGVSSHDWGRIDPHALSQRALDKCVASRNPVAIEPGRYDAILEPQAVHDLVQYLVSTFDSRFYSETGVGKWYPNWAGTPEAPYESKRGQRIADSRITIRYDPNNSDLAVPAAAGHGYRPLTWVRNGILTELDYNRPYALKFLNENRGLDAPSERGNGPEPYMIDPGSVSVDEMIASTRRGVLVTRFSRIMLLDFKSIYLTGLTRDGLWLVENGKIAKPIKNFRFMESPLFMLNNLEQLGAPAVPVFNPSGPAIVPPMKVRDFNFSSLIDAI